MSYPAIIQECFEFVYHEQATEITLPASRIDEFVVACFANRNISGEEFEARRRSCVNGEAKAFGVTVRFE